jgi:vitamin B12 transporter
MTVRVEFLRVTDSYALSRSTPTTALKLDDYSVVNAKISQAFWNDRMRIFGRVENAFDENYEESFGFPQPGRTWFAGVDFRL